MDESLIKSIAQKFYGEVSEVRHLRTSINTLYSLHFVDSPAKILKYCDDPHWQNGLLREQTVLPALQKLGLEVPVIEHTQADTPDFSGNFSIMARDAEYSLSEYYQTNPTDYSHLFIDMGKWLAKLHTIAPDAVDGIVSKEQALLGEIRERREIYDLLVKADMMKPDYYPLFQRFEKIQKQARPDLIHGDFNAAQIMVDATKKLAYIIDWDSVQYGRAMRDLGMCMAYTKFYDRAILEAPKLHDAYESVRPLTDAERHECLHWELYALLRLTANAVLRDAENHAHYGKQLIQTVYMKVI